MSHFVMGVLGFMIQNNLWANGFYKCEIEKGNCMHTCVFTLTIYTYGLVSFCGRHIFGSQAFFKSRIRPLALHPPPVEGKFPGMSLFYKDCDRPSNARTRGLLFHPSSPPHVLQKFLLVSMGGLSGGSSVHRPGKCFLHMPIG